MGDEGRAEVMERLRTREKNGVSEKVVSDEPANAVYLRMRQEARARRWAD